MEKVIRFVILLLGMMAITTAVLMAKGIEFTEAVGLSVVTSSLKTVWATLHHCIFHTAEVNFEEPSVIDFEEGL